jgi:hypothetical protein
MTLHISFVQYPRGIRMVPDTAFIENRTGQEIAYGSYNKQGVFEVIGSSVEGVEVFVSAALAYRKINERLVDRYGY